MTQLEELKNGLGDFNKIRTIITNKDTSLSNSIKLRDIIFAFLQKVEKRISNKKRIDLYCFDNAHKDQILEPSKAEESWIIVSINKDGICSRAFKRSHSWHIEMIGNHYSNSDDKAQHILNTLNNPNNQWIYDNLEDEATKEVLQKFIAFLTKHFILLNNTDTSTLKYSTSKTTHIPTQYLNCIDYKGKYEILMCNITAIRYNTEHPNILTLESDVPFSTEIRSPTQIVLNDYKHYYLLQQNYDIFTNLLKEIKAELNEKSKSINTLFNELNDDVETLKTDLGHIFVLDAI